MITTDEILKKIKSLNNVVVVARIFNKSVEEEKYVGEIKRLLKLLNMKKLKKTLRFMLK